MIHANPELTRPIMPVTEEWDVSMRGYRFQQGVSMPMDQAEATAMKHMPTLWYRWRHDDAKEPRDCAQFWAEGYQ